MSVGSKPPEVRILLFPPWSKISLVEIHKYEPEERLANLDKARKVAVLKTEFCVYCKQYFCKAGIKAHIKKCSSGKKCPVCGDWFSSKGVTCSHGCANTFFRSGDKNPNWSDNAYRTTCFKYHAKKCVVCGEDKVVEVHHLDENKKNNKPENLVPLCPTHHKYWHSRYKYLIEDLILNYIEVFKSN